MQADPRSPEHGQYGFLQDLLRKVAYETLAKADRKARHLAAAAFLEQSLIEQEVVEVVASHYLAAYEAAPDAADAAEIRAKAGGQLARAGERAASLGANEEAERYFAQAAELADDPLAEAELEERAGRSAWLGARGEQARGYLDRALAVFESEGMTRRVARISAVLAEIDHREGHPSEAVVRLEAALETLAGEEARRGYGRGRRAARPLPRAQQPVRGSGSPARAGTRSVRGARPAGGLRAGPDEQVDPLHLPEPAGGGAHPARGGARPRTHERPARCGGSCAQQPGGEPRVARPVQGRGRYLQPRPRARAPRRRPGLGGDLPLRADSARSC